MGVLRWIRLCPYRQLAQALITQKEKHRIAQSCPSGSFPLGASMSSILCFLIFEKHLAISEVKNVSSFKLLTLTFLLTLPFFYNSLRIFLNIKKKIWAIKHNGNIGNKSKLFLLFLRKLRSRLLFSVGIIDF